MATKITFFILFQFRIVLPVEFSLHNWENVFPLSSVRPKYTKTTTFDTPCTQWNQYYTVWWYTQVYIYSIWRTSNVWYVLMLLLLTDIHKTWKRFSETNHQTKSIDAHVHALPNLHSVNLKPLYSLIQHTFWWCLVYLVYDVNVRSLFLLHCHGRFFAGFFLLSSRFNHDGWWCCTSTMPKKHPFQCNAIRYESMAFRCVCVSSRAKTTL